MAIAEHVWSSQHAIECDGTSIVGHTRRPSEILDQEDERLNWDKGLELLGCRIATIKNIGKQSRSQLTSPLDVHMWLVINGMPVLTQILTIVCPDVNLSI